MGLLARILHSHENFFSRNIRLPCGQSDFVAASPDKVGPTGRTFHTSECEKFGLAHGRPSHRGAGECESAQTRLRDGSGLAIVKSSAPRKSGLSITAARDGRFERSCK